MEGQQNNRNRTIIGIIVQAGAVGIALVAVYLMYSLASNHISDSTRVQIELKGVIENNTKALDNLERTIDIKFNK